MATPHDTIGWYDTNASTYAASATGYVDEDQIHAFTTLLPEQAMILDVGCGSGRDTAIFNERGFCATGLDLSEGLLAIARRDNPMIPFIRGSMTSMPFEDASFDGLWVHASLLHLESESEITSAFREFRRVLHDGGIMHVATQSREETEPALTTRLTDGDRPRLFRLSTEGEIRRLFDTNGFSVVILEKYKEGDKFPGGRMDIGRIHALARRIAV